MTSMYREIFQDLSKRIGFEDGIFIREKKGSVPSTTEVIRICVDGIMTKVILNNLKPKSPVLLKVNAQLHTEMSADEDGTIHMELEYPINLDRVHCMQACFQGSDSEKPIEYEIMLKG